MSDPDTAKPALSSNSALRRPRRGLSLARQFGYAGSTVLVIGMFAMGVWVTEKIATAVIQNTGASSALYVDSFVTPLVQELAESEILSDATRQKLDALMEQTPLGQGIVSFKIWKEGGLIAYSSRPEIIGRRFPPTPNLQRAWSGTVSAEFDTLEDDEDALERTAGVPLLEIYSPVREIGTGRIIAVSEFYSVASEFKDDLVWTRAETWLVVAAVTATMLGLLFGIVLRGSRTIDTQQRALETQIADLSMLLRQNEELRARVQRASKRTSENTERFLRRIGSELHDGPAQLLAVASLRLDALKPLVESHAHNDRERSDLSVIRDSLAEALSEIRQISAGLMLPELDALSPRSLLINVAAAHEKRTRSRVDLDIDAAPKTLPRPFKICVYRFVQEALNNAWHHAGGAGQKVTCRCDKGTIEVTVSDSGPGFDLTQVNTGSRLGLRGLRERVESLGGTMSIDSAPGAGTRITMRAEFRSGKDEDDD